jgi:hypothetical protein
LQPQHGELSHRRPHKTTPGGFSPGAAHLAVKIKDFEPLAAAEEFNRMAEIGVRREKAALSGGCKAHPAFRSSRKQPEQSWR